MSYTHRDCAVGRRMDFGSIGAGEATSELETYKVQEVSFGVAVSNLDGQAAFQLEGKIGESWSALVDSNILLDGDPEGHSGNGMLVYSHCASLEAIRCRFISATGDLVPSAVVLAKGVKIAE